MNGMKKSSNSIFPSRNRRKRKSFFQVLSQILINFSLARFCATLCSFFENIILLFYSFLSSDFMLLNQLLSEDFFYVVREFFYFLYLFYQDMRWTTVKCNVFNEKNIGFWNVSAPAGSFDWKSQTYALIPCRLHECYNLIH